MLKKISFFATFLFAILILNPVTLKAQAAEPNQGEIDSMLVFMDSIANSFSYENGKVLLSGNVASLNIPQGFKFLNATQSREVLTNLWGNPEDNTVLGMIFPDSMGPLTENSWAFVVTFDDIGYVKDDDANSIDYDELMKNMKKDVTEENAQRIEQGYDKVELVGWAAKPYYDKSNKVLHWAQEVKFGDAEINTLNYNVRVLGRKGVLVLNAVGSMENLADVNAKIDGVLGMVEFSDGQKYSEFNPGIDRVAAYTIGGLVAGKVLAKAGLFVILAKFAKFIFIGLAAFGVGIWRFIAGRRNQGPPSPGDNHL